MKLQSTWSVVKEAYEEGFRLGHTEAHQAGIDEAVERIDIAIRSALQEVFPLPDDAKDFMGEFERATVGGGYMVKKRALEALDNTIKALQDNK